VPAWEVTPFASTFPKVRLTRRRVADRNAVSAKLNQVEVSVRSATTDSVTLTLRDNVLQRAEYQYRVTTQGGPAGGWTSTHRSLLVLPISDRGGQIEIRGVNIRGVAGPASTVAIGPAAGDSGPSK
jgi:hypothetical protein